MGSIKEDESSAKISSTVIFNLALAYQLVGMKGNQISRVSLKKSAKLYELSFLMERGEEQWSDIALFSMAIFNNLGLIYNALEQKEKAEKCFKQLLANLMFMVERKEGLLSAISEFEGFYENTLHLNFSHVSVASAA